MTERYAWVGWDRAKVFRWLKSVMLDPDLPPLAKVIAYWLSEHFNRESATAYPSYGRLALLSSKSRSSVIRGVKALVDRGYVRVEETNRYDLPSNSYSFAEPPNNQKLAAIVKQRTARRSSKNAQSEGRLPLLEDLRTGPPVDHRENEGGSGGERQWSNDEAIGSTADRPGSFSGHGGPPVTPDFSEDPSDENPNQPSDKPSSAHRVAEADLEEEELDDTMTGDSEELSEWERDGSLDDDEEQHESLPVGDEELLEAALADDDELVPTEFLEDEDGATN
jgi:hypothetical protein